MTSWPKLMPYSLKLERISEAPTVLCLIDYLWSILLIYVFFQKSQLVSNLTCFFSYFYSPAKNIKVGQLPLEFGNYLFMGNNFGGIIYGNSLSKAIIYGNAIFDGKHLALVEVLSNFLFSVFWAVC